MLPQSADLKNIKCPFKTGVYEFPERKLEVLVANSRKYIPKFVKLGMTFHLKVLIFFKENDQNFDICETNEIYHHRVI